MKKLISKIILPALLALLLSVKPAMASEADGDNFWRFLPEFARVAPVPTPGAEVEKPASKPPEEIKAWEKFKYQSLIAVTADKYSLDPQLIYATIMTESEGNERAYRFEPHLNEPSLCMGQILVSTARGLGFEGDPLDLYEPEVCIDLIGRYYRTFLDRYGELSTHQLVQAYNTGSPWKRSYYGHLSRFNKWFYEES